MLPQQHVQRQRKAARSKNAAAIDDERRPRRWDVVLKQNKPGHKGGVVGGGGVEVKDGAEMKERNRI